MVSVDKILKQQLQSLIKEKMIELDRLRAEYESLQKTDREQNDKMEQLSLKAFFFVLLTTLSQCQTGLVDTGTCACDLIANKCDVSCCCDADCSSDEINTFNCGSSEKQDTNSIPSSSSVQSTCFKDISIFKSNSPYVVKKKGDLVCLEHTQDNQNQQLLNQKLNLSVLARSINTDNSVLSSLGTPTNLTLYQVGTSIFRYFSSSNTTSHYSLPIKLFNSQSCSGLQPITYLNDFTSTCTQQVTADTCADALDTSKYVNSFCLIQFPAALAGNKDNICCSAAATATSCVTSPFSNVLQSLTLTIYYSNPTGIVNCSITLTSINAAVNTTLGQTFAVRFIQSGSSVSNTSGRSGNPGYLQGAPIIAGTLSGSTITPTTFTILSASSQGDCFGTNRITISFGQNVRSICQFSTNTSRVCPTLAELQNIFISTNLSNLYVAISGNPDPSNITGSWFQVISCTSEIGSSDAPVCQTGFLPSSPSSDQCYIRLDIQIAYANIGSVGNPQPILGAVVFYYQRVTNTSTATVTSPLLITQTVTFQDISNPPVTEGDQIPRPNIRLVGDFFYPFSLNRGTTFMSFSSSFCVLVIFAFILM